MSNFTKKLLDGLAWRVGVYVSTFLLNILVASYLGAAAGGDFYLLISNLTYVILFFTAGIDGAISFFNARKEIAPGQLFFLSIVWTAAVICVFSGIFYVLKTQNLIAPQVPATYLLLYVAGNLLANFLSTIIFSLHNNKAPNIIFSLVNIALIIFVLIQKFSGLPYSEINFLPWYLLSGPVLAVLFCGWLLAKKIFPAFALPAEIYRSKFFQFASRAFLFTLLYALLMRCDYWLVDYFCDQQDLGNYIQTTKLNQVILFIPALASFTLFPLVVSQIKTEQHVELKIMSLVNIYFFISLSLCLGLAAVGWWAFPMLYGRTYNEMFVLFLLLAPGLVMLATANPLSTFFSGHDQIFFITKAIAAAIVLMIVADIIFIPALGVYGAAIGSSLGYALYFIILLTRFQKRFNLSYKSVYDLQLLRNSLGKIANNNRK